MNEIAKIKQEVKLRQWAEMIQQRKESGLTVSQWCTENGVNIKTYYYRLKKVRQAMCKKTERHDIVPVCESEEEKINSERIEIYAGELRISLPDNFNEETLQRLLGVLK